jgi:hypothetical protein
MCLNCGCGEPDKRHHPTDITRDDLQRAADGAGMTLERAATNVQESISAMSGGKADAQKAAAGSSGKSY